MKHSQKIALAIALATVTSSALAQSEKLSTEAEKVGYAIGTDIGTTFAEMNADGKNNVDFNALIVGIRDAYEKRDPAISKEDMAKVMQEFAQKRQEEMKAKAQEMVKKSTEESQKFLDENAKKDGVKTTASGLQYKIEKEGTGKQPGPNDDVSVQYEGRLIDGTVFDSSKNNGGKPVEFNVQDVIPGWVEGLQLMKEGSTYTFYIPAKLAYGDFGQPQAGIMPGAALVFDVTLEKVMPKNTNDTGKPAPTADAAADAANNATPAVEDNKKAAESSDSK